MNEFDTGFVAAKTDAADGWFIPSEWSSESLRSHLMVVVGGSPEWIDGYVAGAFAS